MSTQRKPDFVKRLILSTVGMMIMYLPVQQSFAQIEEIVVTARKREESLQDVPISVQAISGDYISEQGIMDLQALELYTPNFAYTTGTGASDLLVMRGVGTIGSGFHFEPGVATVLNGYFSTRSRLGRTAMIDLAQVEVLKGPQGAIIGKNTSLGVINIRSNRPTEEFEAKVSAGYNFEASEGAEVTGIISGPLSDNIRARAVVNYRDLDGWIENRATGNTDAQREDLTTRLMVDIDLSDNLTAELMWQRSDIDRNGKAKEPIACIGNPARAAALGEDCTLNASNQHGNIRAGVDVGEPFSIESDLLGATLTWELDSFDITSLTAYMEYEIRDMFSGDGLPTERVSVDNHEGYEQFTQEVRITSTGDNVVDYIAGAMYFTGELDGFQNANNAAIPRGFLRHEESSADTDSYALFGQIDYHLSDQLTLSAGGRFTDESRDGTKRQVAAGIYSGIYDSPIVENGRCAPAGNFGFTGCTRGNSGTGAGGDPVTGEIDKTNFSYNVSAQWAPADDHMVYVKYATGFKSGGFDLRGLGDPAAFVFGEEESKDFEIGGKHLFADGRLRANWSIFLLNVDDLQVSTNDAVNIQQIVGAADVESKGVEFDFLWALTDSFNLSLAGAYTDAVYEEFQGACYTLQTAAQGCVGGIQNQAGQQMPYAPEWTFVTGADYSWQLAGDTQLRASAKWIYQDSRSTQVDNPPALRQGSTSRLDATIALSGILGSGNAWTLSLVGRNLTDELAFGFSSVSATAGGGTRMQRAFTDETRAIALRGSVAF